MKYQSLCYDIKMKYNDTYNKLIFVYYILTFYRNANIIPGLTTDLKKLNKPYT